MDTTIVSPHEIISIFEAHQIPLFDTLAEMLNEHYTHRTERRGCGYTQATRVLAGNVNLRRDTDSIDDLRLFNRPTKPLRFLMTQASTENLCLDNWRNLDLRADLAAMLADRVRVAQNPVFFEMLAAEIKFQSTLRHICDHLELEESKLFAQLLIDIILPRDAQVEGLISLPSLPEKPKVGSCTLAEKFFLEIACGVIPRKGRVNIIVDEYNNPLLMEKLNIGDSHSCINVTPLMMNGVRLPLGSLFAVEYDPDLLPQHPCKQLKGQVIPMSACTGFRFLRLTTFAVSSANRARAFTSHMEWQSAASLFSFYDTNINQIQALAMQQL